MPTSNNPSPNTAPTIGRAKDAMLVDLLLAGDEFRPSDTFLHNLSDVVVAGLETICVLLWHAVCCLHLRSVVDVASL